jgi:hypothetical protein
MSALRFADKAYLEKVFEMEYGYVLGFTNRTFSEFFASLLGIEIYHDKYGIKGDSKANRLRTFWEIESNSMASKSIAELAGYAISFEPSFHEEELIKCNLIAQKLLEKEGFIANVEMSSPAVVDSDISQISRLIANSLENGVAHLEIDRLHLLMVKFIKFYMRLHGLDINDEKPMHALFGEYIKHLRRLNIIETEITEFILKSNISILDKLNHARNQRSLAHDNELLTPHEAAFIVSSISNLVKFIEDVESRFALAEPDEDGLEPPC